ncbi:hypothetical protein IV38_GL001368 [Lactobacillus selangorensis]|uniref:DUF1659 domain-containing protein n=1 Tax=Lactobacillus selangorensis TaxID=81857 RepID=A0A0R2FI95_9LACO|nr:hypothetical protein [Lactobacillus selangorensis]KRN28369.1 hypothetical protein IV38_GL001368 [Lactobacillus selangorensis]KRN31870.1 hypothetical protein IV40_GL001155 [Lactobacillus selangorensis]
MTKTILKNALAIKMGHGETDENDYTRRYSNLIANPDEKAIFSFADVLASLSAEDNVTEINMITTTELNRED